MARATIAALSLLALGAACSETRRPLGEDCLKDDDCLSGLCSQLACAASPKLLDGAIGPPAVDAGPSMDASDGSMDAPIDTAPPPMDAPSDG